MLYIDGQFVGLKEFTAPEPSLAACKEEAQRESLKILEGAGESGYTYAAIGACIPVPPASVATATKEVPPENPNLTHEDGRQTL